MKEFSMPRKSMLEMEEDLMVKTAQAGLSNNRIALGFV
jgi:hypothetical protein